MGYDPTVDVRWSGGLDGEGSRREEELRKLSLFVVRALGYLGFATRTINIVGLQAPLYVTHDGNPIALVPPPTEEMDALETLAWLRMNNTPSCTRPAQPAQPPVWYGL